MTTIEEIENEIAAVSDAIGIIDERTGSVISNSLLIIELRNYMKALMGKLEDYKERQRMDLPVHPFEREYEHEDKWNH